MPGSGVRSIGTLAVLVAAIGIAVAAVRDAAARAPSTHPLSALSRWWPGHPEAVIDRLMIDSAVGARSGRPLDSGSRAALRALAQDSPLAAQPFMIEGAIAQLDGDMDRARRLYRAARLRNPRSPAVRLLLADLELRSGNVEQGLADLVAIPRIFPTLTGPVVPALAQFARSPGAIEKMRAAFESNPRLGQTVLENLAADPANGPLILSLASGTEESQAILAWQQRLIDSSVAGGQVAQARQYWARFNRVGRLADNALFNPAFQRRPESPPFNWTLTSGSAGVAELADGGGLSIVHFGREPALLAAQLVSLDAGTYALRTELAGPVEPGRLQWRVRCVDSPAAQAIPADGGGGTFRIGPDCAAAWLELQALPGETEQRLDVILRRADLRKVG